MPSRRRLMQGGVAAGAAVALGAPRLLTGRAYAAVPDAPQLPGTEIRKYATPLTILPAMPSAETSSSVNFSVTARRFKQQVLPPEHPKTTVQGFGSTNDPRTNHSPGYTLEARANKLSRVTWINGLMDSQGNFLPQMFPVDQTLHWSNPPGGVEGRDSAPDWNETPPAYTGPHTLIVHHHGAHDFQESDGYPEAWYLPNARNIPPGFARVGSFYDQFKEEARQRWGVNWPAGANISVYPNDQAAMTLWYHDHSLGTTRLGVHSGLVGFSILRGGPFDLPQGVLPGPAPRPGDPPGIQYREIMLVLADRSFTRDGEILFPQSSHVETPPYEPFSDIPPLWNHQAVGDTVTVNGTTWPFLDVEARRYRFRILSGANQLPFGLRVVTAPGNQTAATQIWVIGSDGGFMPQPVPLGDRPLDIYTSERYDIIVDFAGFEGQELFLTSSFGNREVMKFVVHPATSEDTTTPPDQLQLPYSGDVSDNIDFTRQLFLERGGSETRPELDPVRQPAHFWLGNVENGVHVRKRWEDPVTETPALGATEIWELENITPGNHAVHIHLIEFQAIDRLDRATRQPIPDGLLPFEVGRKDTILTPSNTITRVKGTYDRRVRMIWHCHFVDHEDHAMMRPMVIG